MRHCWLQASTGAAIDSADLTLFYPGPGLVRMGSERQAARRRTSADSKAATPARPATRQRAGSHRQQDRCWRRRQGTMMLSRRRSPANAASSVPRFRQRMTAKISTSACNGPTHRTTPAPFVDGGKMDPENQIKVAMMITGTGIELGEQVGCWATCHADNTYMPFDPGAEAIAANGDVAAAPEGRTARSPSTLAKAAARSRSKVAVAKPRVVGTS